MQLFIWIYAHHLVMDLIKRKLVKFNSYIYSNCLIIHLQICMFNFEFISR